MYDTKEEKHRDICTKVNKKFRFDQIRIFTVWLINRLTRDSAKLILLRNRSWL